MITLSPSNVGMMNQCPRCFWLQYHGKPRPRGAFPSITSGVDRVMKQVFDEWRHNPSQIPLFMPKRVLEDNNWTVYPDQQIVDTFRAIRKGLWFTIKDYSLHGLLDDMLLEKAIDHSGQDKIVILDFKTKGNAPKDDGSDFVWYRDQLDLYAYLVAENGYEVADKAALLYVYPAYAALNGDIMEYGMYTVPVSVHRGLNRFYEAVAMLDGKEPSAEEKCEYCRYRGEI